MRVFPTSRTGIVHVPAIWFGQNFDQQVRSSFHNTLCRRAHVEFGGREWKPVNEAKGVCSYCVRDLLQKRAQVVGILAELAGGQ